MANNNRQQPAANAKPTYKQQLDQAAEGHSASSLEMAASVKDTIIEKVTEYIPQTAKTLNQFSSKPQPQAEDQDAAAANANANANGTSGTDGSNGSNGSIGSSQVTADSKSETSQKSTGPERPHHDIQIEEFLREQHRSKGGKDVAKVAKGKV